MAIDYQQILMDMNRPHRRQGKSMKTIVGAVILLGVIFAGTFSAWKYGIVDKAVDGAGDLVARVLDRQPSAPAPVVVAVAPGAAGEAAGPAASPQAAAAPLRPPQSLRPASGPAPALTAQSSGAEAEPMLSVQAVASAAPSLSETSSPVQELQPLQGPRPIRSASPAEAQAQLQAQAMQQTRFRQEREEEHRRMQRALAEEREAKVAAAGAAGPETSAPPVLSDARAQLRAIDAMLNSDPSGALERLNTLSRSSLEAADAAEVGYRRGYAARVLRDEALAERSWQETVDLYPNTRGGRFSALALGDTWFQRYAAAARPQLSYWDDIQLMYSRVLGVDDAPFLPDAARREVKTRLGTLNDALFFGSAPTKMARYHKIEDGELLAGIASKYRVDYESIARVNGINPNRIRAGMDLKIVVGDVDVVVRKNTAHPDKGPSVTWFLDGRWVREYPACVGDGMKTPAGTYTLTSKERDPSWTNPANGQLLANDHPENILGSRWMAMKGMNTQGLGIHGTTVDDSIPGYTSAGCVRLHNFDVEELFSYARIGGRVTIIE